MQLNNRQPGRARVDAWIGIAAGTVAAAAAIASSTPGGWAAGGVGAVAGGAIALRRGADFSQGRRLELGAEQIMDAAQLAALAWLMKPPAVAAQLQAEPEPAPLPQSAWWHEVLEAQFLLICGPQGSGKTSLAQAILQARLQLGHTVTALDPHARYGQYPAGVTVAGAGKDYKAIDRAIADFTGDIERYYQAIAHAPTETPAPHTLVLEELTQWAAKTKSAPELIAVGCSDIRKAGKFLMAISHGRTLATLGGASGFRATLDAAITTVELEVSRDRTGRPQPAFSGKLYRPGCPNEPVAIAIDPAPQTAPAPLPAAASGGDAIAQLERAWQMDVIEVPHETIAREPAAPTPEQQELIEAICAIAQRIGKSITPSDCIRNSRPLKALGADGIRSLFIVAQAMGRGTYADGKFTLATR